MKRRTSKAIGCALLGLALAGFSAAQAQQLEYAAKIICGLPDAKLGNLVVQQYRTTINVHNPNATTAWFLKKIALAIPPGRERPGKIVQVAVDTLKADEALAVDCLDLQKPAGGAPFFEGLVVLQSRWSLDVTGVYTVPGGIAVEQVRERVKPR